MWIKYNEDLANYYENYVEDWYQDDFITYNKKKQKAWYNYRKYERTSTKWFELNRKLKGLLIKHTDKSFSDFFSIWTKLCKQYSEGYKCLYDSLNRIIEGFGPYAWRWFRYKCCKYYIDNNGIIRKNHFEKKKKNI